MRLYLLFRKELTYDAFGAKLIRAKSQKQARKIANEEVCGEGEIWENKELVECTVITNEGTVGVVIASFNAG